MTSRIVAVLLVVWIAPAPLGAQDARSRPAFRAQTDLVRIVASVKDANGQPVTNLAKEQFAIAEDGKPQEIALFTTDVETPLSVVLVLDISGSMGDSIEAVRQGVRGYVETLRPDDEVALVTFTGTIRVHAGFADSRDQLLAALDSLKPGGSTALYDAMIAASRLVAKGRHQKRVIILVTDGNNTMHGGAYRDTAVNVVQRSEALVYALGIGRSNRGSVMNRMMAKLSGPQMDVLRGFTDDTGGRSELVDGIDRDGPGLVAETITRFGVELRQQYTLGSYPPARGGRGKLRQVRVSTTVPDYVVRARRVYVAR